jgi:hypothetical protein
MAFCTDRYQLEQRKRTERRRNRTCQYVEKAGTLFRYRSDVMQAHKALDRLADLRESRIACPDLYQLLYRTLSSDGTHASINSLDRFVEADATGRITAFKVAPDTTGLVEALSAACLLFIWAAEPFAVTFNRPDISAGLSKRVQQFAQLPGAFPKAKALRRSDLRSVTPPRSSVPCRRCSPDAPFAKLGMLTAERP